MRHFKNYKFSFSFGPHNVHFRIELSLSLSLSCNWVEMAEMPWLWCHVWCYRRHCGAMYGVIKRRCDNPATHWRPKINIRHASPWLSIRDLGATWNFSPFGPFGSSGSTAAFGRWCIEDLGLRPRWQPSADAPRPSWVNGVVV